MFRITIQCRRLRPTTISGCSRSAIKGARRATSQLLIPLTTAARSIRPMASTSPIELQKQPAYESDLFRHRNL